MVIDGLNRLRMPSNKVFRAEFILIKFDAAIAVDLDVEIAHGRQRFKSLRSEAAVVSRKR